MKKPARSGDAMRFLLENYKTERSRLTIGLEELARICGD